MSNPCLNGGICTPTTSTEIRTRFNCSCRGRFSGTRSENYPTSCSGLSFSHNVSGKYKISNTNMDTFEVFCDFDFNASIAWTLIQSYRLNESKHVKESFFFDRPINQDTPSWNMYRLSLSRMESIRKNSHKWRITCDYETDGTVYIGFVVGSVNDADIVSFRGFRCAKVDYINIRGQSCRDCTTFAKQGLPMCHFILIQITLVT